MDIVRTVYKPIGESFIPQDPILEDGTNVAIEFTKNGVDYVTLCVNHKTFDYSNGICETVCVRYAKLNGELAYLGSFTRRCDGNVCRNGNLEDPYFGMEIPCDDINAMTNSNFFFKYGILGKVISIGDYIYSEMEIYETLNQ